MIKSQKILLIFTIVACLCGCSQTLQLIDLKLDTEDSSAQDEFNVVEKTLTLKEAKRLSNAPYIRSVLQNGRGETARPILESIALISNFPKNEEKLEYKIGIGDILTFSRLLENNRSTSKTKDQWPAELREQEYILGVGDTLALTIMKDDNSISQLGRASQDNGSERVIINSQNNDETLNSTGRIGSDGSVLLLEVGRLEADGKTLNELRSEVRNILIRNGVSPRFQLEIVNFQSQKAYLTVNAKSEMIILEDKTTTLKDLLTLAGVGFQPGVITRIRLQRDGEEYYIKLREIFNEDAPSVDIRAKDHIIVEDSSAAIQVTTSTVDQQGNVVFEGVGKIKAEGHSLSEIREKIHGSMKELPDSQNAFQIQITGYLSKRAVINIPGREDGIIPIIEKATLLRDLLTQYGLQVNADSITRIKLQRDNKLYVFSLDDLLNPVTDKVYVKSDDLIIVETLPYKENKVFIVGGINPQIFKIQPTKRESLADILFTSGGVLSSSSAKRSEVYLLRGSNPVFAYHLDAQSPTRLIVADAMELRPNDILYVAEQPIISFNRTLSTIVPLRILLRDIQDENIP